MNRFNENCGGFCVTLLDFVAILLLAKQKTLAIV
jgi:hypothetical protein